MRSDRVDPGQWTSHQPQVLFRRFRSVLQKRRRLPCPSKTTGRSWDFLSEEQRRGSTQERPMGVKLPWGHALVGFGVVKFFTPSVVISFDIRKSEPPTIAARKVAFPLSTIGARRRSGNGPPGMVKELTTQCVNSSLSVEEPEIRMMGTGGFRMEFSDPRHPTTQAVEARGSACRWPARASKRPPA